MANKAWHHLYKGRWVKIRAAQLANEPLCRMCRAEGKLTPATVADHIKPHKGDLELFYNGELQSLCAHHHNSVKQAEEKAEQLGLRTAPAGIDGYPTDSSW